MGIDLDRTVKSLALMIDAGFVLALVRGDLSLMNRSKDVLIREALAAIDPKTQAVESGIMIHTSIAGGRLQDFGPAGRSSRPLAWLPHASIQ